jgi:hypothetical protein
MYVHCSVLADAETPAAKLCVSARSEGYAVVIPFAASSRKSVSSLISVEDHHESQYRASSAHM